VKGPTRWLAITLFASFTSNAEPRDDRAVVRIHVGKPPGHATMERIDPERDGRTSLVLPTTLALVWNTELNGNIELSPSVDAAGRLLVIHGANFLSQLEPSGKVAWSRELATAPVVPPLLVSSGQQLVADANGHISALSTNGTPTFEVTLPIARGARALSPLGLDQGGAVFAFGNDLFELDAFGSVIAQTHLDGPTALFGDGARVFVLSDKGSLYRWSFPLDPAPIASLGAPASSDPVLIGSRMFALSAGQLVSLDVTTGAKKVLRELDASARTLLAVGAPSFLASFGRDGSAFGTDPFGRELFRQVAGDGTLAPTVEWGDPVALSDVRGTLMFANQSTLATRDPSGKSSALKSPCSMPIALVPTGHERVALTCATGAVSVFGSRGSVVER
jgi:outer membrane protein assembly factor BamB